MVKRVRDSVTGQYVDAEEAKLRPETTVSETVGDSVNFDRTLVRAEVAEADLARLTGLLGECEAKLAAVRAVMAKHDSVDEVARLSIHAKAAVGRLLDELDAVLQEPR